MVEEEEEFWFLRPLEVAYAVEDRDGWVWLAYRQLGGSRPNFAIERVEVALRDDLTLVTAYERVRDNGAEKLAGHSAALRLDLRSASRPIADGFTGLFVPIRDALADHVHPAEVFELVVR